MFVTGISDEAGKDLETQIRAHRELNWSRMEIRDVSVAGGHAQNVHDISEAEFGIFEKTVKDSGMEVFCFSSRIANWSKQIDAPFDSSLEEAARCIARMKRMNTRFVRVMSFAVRKDTKDQMPLERFRRLRELVKRFQGEGMTVLHENCMNYGGMGWPFTLELLENVPGLQLVFDTGNPVSTDDRSKPEPWPKQSAWEFYSHVRDHIAYVHIKDCVWNEKIKGIEFCFPGDGQGDVKRILHDLTSRGYAGGLSIEPHMALANSGSSSAEAYAIYLEYGRRLEKLIQSVKYGTHTV